MPALPNEIILGSYLRHRRSKLDPTSLGFPAGRRRTPGLRREEVAQRAHVSVTWYTWLEQGRGGKPSTEALGRLEKALMLNPSEREHLYLLAGRRAPETTTPRKEQVSATVQRVLDSMKTMPAFVKNALWDVLAWNEAAASVLIDFSALPPENSNLLRILFTDPEVAQIFPDWEERARFVVAVFRADIARFGASKRARTLIDELSTTSPYFAALWQQRDVATAAEGVKTFHLPGIGPVSFGLAVFSVQGEQQGLSMLVFSPARAEDLEKISELMARTEPKNEG